jgi:Fur family transcriptional regulator, ferric uptake regulator
MTTPIEMQFRAKGLRLTKQRRLIVEAISEAISEANGCPDFAELYRRATGRNRRVSRATVYRALRLLTSEGIIECYTFRGGWPRFGSLGGAS